MNIEEYHQDFLISVRSCAEARRDFVRTCFVEEAGSRLGDAEEVTDLQVCHYEGLGARKRRLQVDGYAFDEADGSMALLVAEFSNNDELQSFGASEARRAFSALTAFVEEALDGNLTNGSIDEGQPGYGLAADIMRLHSNIVRFRFYLVSDGQLNTRVQEWLEEEVQDIPVEFHIWDIAHFHRVYESAGGRDAIDVSFCEDGFDGLPYLAAGSAEGEYEAYLCMIPGPVLGGIYERYGSRLLEGNVRSFLSTKGKVNSGIQITIQDRPEMFFAYNNGIAATAEAIAVNDSDDAPRIKSATNLQIVNGGQTTASLATAMRTGADLSRVCVQMKLSVLPPNKAFEVIPLIARFANSQNKVNDADFFANHPYHVRLEEISRRLWTPALPGTQHGSHWFYERARGQYLNEQAGLSKAQKAKFLLQNPKAQLLTKTDIAKIENTWRGFPHKVSFGAQKNFLTFAEWVAKEWSEDDQQFNEEYYRYLVALAILFRHCEAMVSKQPWYQGGYRANVITYTLAKLQYMIHKDAKGRQLDLSAIWVLQAVPREVSGQLVLIAASIFKVLTHPSRPKENVTEWAKMPTCWIKVQEERVPLNTEILVQQYDPKLERALREQAAGVQPVGYGLFARTAVMGIDGPQWNAMRQWGLTQGLLNARDSDLLRAASRIPKFTPGAKDCEKLLKIKTKLIARGFESESHNDGQGIKPEVRGGLSSLNVSVSVDNLRTSKEQPAKTSPLMKAQTPSSALAKVVGEEPLLRTQVVRKMWAYIKENNLQDSKNQKIINADANLMAIFGRQRISMYEIAGLIAKHLKQA